VERVDTVVIGAGVVGLACARALALAGREVVVLEAEGAIGTATSSRNSEVIHAGIYYPPGSLKAKLCVAGKLALYRYLAERSLPHRNCGKLIVAAEPSQMQYLEKLQAQARANGVNDLRLLTEKEAKTLEPALACVAALESPSTGIIDSHAYMLALQGDAENAGATTVFRSPVVRGRVREDGIELEVGGGGATRLLARRVVNSAGLFAPQTAAAIDGFPASHVPPQRFCKGNYFSLTGRSPFRHLIYPVPEKAGLGVHLTLDLAGRARFGPDVEWIDRVDYAVDPKRGERFYRAIRTYWPDLKDAALEPAYSGIRPKIQEDPNAPARDFVIEGARDHGVPGLVNLFGIESPGLTSSLAIADRVSELLSER
jgi:L-2-hydroxyglutarate oxidase LhgO